MMIRNAFPYDEDNLSNLIAAFRVELKKLRGVNAEPDIKNAIEEFRDYIRLEYPIFIAEECPGKFTGYMVCRVAGNVVWVESIYVPEAFRRTRIATRLYREAEKLSEELGSETVYNWVHPNNDAMIGFLSKMGYDVLNLIELRKPLKKELLAHRISVWDHEYRY